MYIFVSESCFLLFVLFEYYAHASIRKTNAITFSCKHNNPNVTMKGRPVDRQRKADRPTAGLITNQQSFLIMKSGLMIVFIGCHLLLF